MEAIIQEFFDEIDFDDVDDCGSTQHTCVGCMSKAYFDGIQIDYSCETKRKLYVVRYLPVHVAEVKKALQSISRDSVNQLLSNQEIHILCVGGGPGTDNLALNEWLADEMDFDNHDVTDVRITRIDKCEEWNDISPRIINRHRPENLDFNMQRITFDITKPGLKLNKAQMVVMSYIMSEINKNQLATVAANLIKNTKNNWILVINDRNEEAVVEKIDTLVGILQGKTVSKKNSSSHCGFNYPDNIWREAEPKIWLKSVRYVVTA